MSAFGFYEKDEVVESIKVLAEVERKNGKNPREVIESIMEAVTCGLDSALYDMQAHSWIE